MNVEELLMQERRARMTAERLLAQKEAELHEANRMLSRHAISLSEDLVETREQVAVVRGENTRVRADLARANTEIDIAKRRLWNSIQSIEDGFAVFDSDGRLVIANSAYLQPFDGLAIVRPGVRYAEIVGAALDEGIVDLEGLSCDEWRATMLGRWVSPRPEPRVIRLWDGTYIRLLDQRAPGGDTVCLGLNITEAMQREAALEEARNRAEAANRAKSAFLANMSHEIRTPMNGVVGMADLLAESALNEEQRLFVDTIRSSGTALLTIINDVLDYSKIEAARLTLKPEPFDLERTILDVIQLMEPSIREKGLQIMLDYDMFLPTRFVGDPVRIRQILTNLVGNAVKFTSQGHVLVRVVGLPRGDDEAAQVHIVVEDTGIGIPDDKLGHVFGEFNQVEDERNRAFEGTGLGLAITKRLVALMQGRIWVESVEGAGSSFGVQLSLPVDTAETARDVPGWIRRVCLVMRDDLHRSILEKRLRTLGLEVNCAPSIDEAGPVDVIFAEEFRAEALPVNTPLVLVVSAGASLDELEPGIMEVLTRPIARPDLIAALHRLPAPTEDDTGAEPPPIEKEAAPPPVAKGNARAIRVLAAEDNKTNQLVFSKLVKACDIDLRFANNGHEAVAAFEAERPDLVFMDISMPGMDGKEATRRIREIEAERSAPPVRIVALTAHAMEGDAEDILSHGLDAYLTKPFKKPAILAEIAEARPEGARPPLPPGLA